MASPAASSQGQSRSVFAGGNGRPGRAAGGGGAGQAGRSCGRRRRGGPVREARKRSTGRPRLTFRETATIDLDQCSQRQRHKNPARQGPRGFGWRLVEPEARAEAARAQPVARLCAACRSVQGARWGGGPRGDLPCRERRDRRRPRTGARVVKRVYTNLAILDVTPRGFAVRDVVAGITLDALQARTEAKLLWT